MSESARTTPATVTSEPATGPAVIAGHPRIYPPPMTRDRETARETVIA